MLHHSCKLISSRNRNNKNTEHITYFLSAMNETNKQSGPALNSKTVGGDVLSKKERRALRVAQKTGSSVSVTKPNKIGAGSNKQNVKVDGSKSNPKKIQTVEPGAAEVPGALESKNTNTKSNIHVSVSPKQEPAKPSSLGEESKLKPDSVGFNETGESQNKAQLKIERRALQEKQRLSKAAVKLDRVDKKENQKPVPKVTPIKPTLLKSEHVNEHQVNLFNHLYFSSIENNQILSDIHLAFVRLGVQYSTKTILGSNARCLALLSALKDLIHDFETPPKQEFCRSLEATLQKSISHLQKCRPLAVSMTNALRHFKLQLTQVDTNLKDSDKKRELLDAIKTYYQDEINTAGQAISLKVNEKITNNDIILTYGCSSLIRKLLLDAHTSGKNFKVIVIDSRPLLEGKEMLRVLISHGIDCMYVLINSVSFVMSKVTKVLLGAHALLANGYVMSRTGTAQVALIAQAYSKPVLVCCETYKFCERVQTDCFVYNEIGDPDELTKVDTMEAESPLTKWRNSKFLTPLNLSYDITPTDLVTAVVTELGFLPCTSVPVVLRIKPTE